MKSWICECFENWAEWFWKCGKPKKYIAIVYNHFVFRKRYSDFQPNYTLFRFVRLCKHCPHIQLIIYFCSVYCVSQYWGAIHIRLNTHMFDDVCWFGDCYFLLDICFIYEIREVMAMNASSLEEDDWIRSTKRMNLINNPPTICR